MWLFLLSTGCKESEMKNDSSEIGIEKANQEESQSYSNAFFSFKYQPNWTINEDENLVPNSKAAVMILGPDSQTNIIVSVIELPVKMGIDQIKDLTLAQFQEQLAEGFSILKEEKILISGENGYRLKYKIKDSEASVVQLITVKDKTFYFITYTNDPEDSEMYDKMTDDLITSFKVI